ncbi:MAG TPA: alkaline phosphatase family protein [Terriglobia bacterium]|nr:alkaline phosphatase family protein [Terriglobia bacterium]
MTCRNNSQLRPKSQFIGFTIAWLAVIFWMPMAKAKGSEDTINRKDIRHVLLISIDGMHALDYTNCVKAGTCPSLAALGRTGVSYMRTSVSKPSDSFPGLMALVTGGNTAHRGGIL